MTKGEEGRGCAKVLVIGFGNPDRGDDAVGPVVAAALARRLPADVEVVERHGDGLGLVEDWDGHDAVICVDAAAPAGRPGRVHRVDVAKESLPPEPSFTSSHAFGLAEAIALARTLGRLPATTVVYAVEGLSFDHGALLTEPVAAAVGAVVERVAAEAFELGGCAGRAP